MTDFWPLVVFAHVLGAIIWVGGQLTVTAVLLPEAHRLLPPGERASLLRAVGRRFAVLTFALFVPLQLVTGVALAAHGSLGWSALLRPGDELTARIDAARRRAHMRLHTATHLLCALVPHPVDGCSITAAHARLDFHTAEPLDKAALSAGIARLVAEAHPVRHRWISEAELDANPQLVRSMSVQPPRGQGRVRVLEIEGVDLQPCGGTHVANTAEIGTVVVTKVEKKSAMTRRVILGFAEAAAGRG